MTEVEMFFLQIPVIYLLMILMLYFGVLVSETLLPLQESCVDAGLCQEGYLLRKTTLKPLIRTRNSAIADKPQDTFRDIKLNL